MLRARMFITRMVTQQTNQMETSKSQPSRRIEHLSRETSKEEDLRAVERRRKNLEIILTRLNPGIPYERIQSEL
jgi:hypothetical protein